MATNKTSVRARTLAGVTMIAAACGRSSRASRRKRDWVATIAATSPNPERFRAQCTLGYDNNEGEPRGARQTYGPGLAGFQRMLREWRAGDGINQVLGDQ